MRKLLLTAVFVLVLLNPVYAVGPWDPNAATCNCVYSERRNCDPSVHSGCSGTGTWIRKEIVGTKDGSGVCKWDASCPGQDWVDNCSTCEDGETTTTTTTTTTLGTQPKDCEDDAGGKCEDRTVCENNPDKKCRSGFNCPNNCCCVDRETSKCTDNGGTCVNRLTCDYMDSHECSQNYYDCTGDKCCCKAKEEPDCEDPCCGSSGEPLATECCKDGKLIDADTMIRTEVYKGCIGGTIADNSVTIYCKATANEKERRYICNGKDIHPEMFTGPTINSIKCIGKDYNACEAWKGCIYSEKCDTNTPEPGSEHKVFFPIVTNSFHISVDKCDLSILITKIDYKTSPDDIRVKVLRTGKEFEVPKLLDEGVVLSKSICLKPSVSIGSTSFKIKRLVCDDDCQVGSECKCESAGCESGTFEASGTPLSSTVTRTVSNPDKITITFTPSSTGEITAKLTCSNPSGTTTESITVS